MPRKSVAEKRKETVDKAEGLIAEAIEVLEGLWQELDEIKGNMEEHFSETERYQRLEEIVDALDSSKTELENARDSLPSDMQYT